MSITKIKRHSAATGPSSRGGSRAGFSVVEVIMAVVVMALGMLGLAAAASFGLKQTTRAKKDLRYNADLEQVADSLINLGYGNVAAGSETVRGRSLSWTLSSPGSNSQLVTLVVVRTNNQESQSAANDTLSLYLAKSTPGS